MNFSVYIPNLYFPILLQKFITMGIISLWKKDISNLKLVSQKAHFGVAKLLSPSPFYNDETNSDELSTYQL